MLTRAFFVAMLPDIPKEGGENMRNRVATYVLMFLCAFFGVLGAVGIDEVSTDFALFAIEVFLIILANFESKN